ncbi:6-carboxytetrahydropterin synthase [Oceanobacillus damuensis]|uniref:6-carboxytetrahydropterin synthase n=1 Tax=Oceanobacillus damuensis TaxID=937928 RepID=UPI001F39F09D|nr:6-carboxytetrahydropterin synthase [Oceanobacillus damuensis]
MQAIGENFDHKHLNLDTEEFEGLNLTSESVVKVVYDMLTPIFLIYIEMVCGNRKRLF